MFIVHIKTRGKVLITPSKEMVRTPQKVRIRNKNHLRMFLSKLKAMCITDYEVNEVDEPMNEGVKSKRIKYMNEDSIYLGGKITSKRGG